MQASIITPTFNSIEFVNQCVLQVVAQADAVREHIIVDGGSTDGTVERILELQKTYDHIKLIPGPDKGQSDAINKGTCAASSEIIGMLNCDDEYIGNAVSEGVAILSTQKVPTLIAGNCLVRAPEGNHLAIPNDLRSEALLLGYDLAHHPVNPASYFYHRSVHDIVGGYDIDDHYTLDLDFLLKCAELVNMKHVDTIWGVFNLRPGCKTMDDQDHVFHKQQVFDKFQSRLTLARKINQRILKFRKSRWKRLNAAAAVLSDVDVSLGFQTHNEQLRNG